VGQPLKGDATAKKPGDFKYHPTIQIPQARAQAVREARPIEGNGPDEGGSAFFGRTKNDGNNRKTNPTLSKTAQFP